MGETERGLGRERERDEREGDFLQVTPPVPVSQLTFFLFLSIPYQFPQQNTLGRTGNYRGGTCSYLSTAVVL